MDPHPIIDQGSVDQFKTFIKAAVESPSSAEGVELYWYMLEIFTDYDSDKDGIIKLAEFPAMMKEFLEVPKRHSLTVPTEGDYEALFKKHDPRNDDEDEEEDDDEEGDEDDEDDADEGYEEEDGDDDDDEDPEEKEEDGNEDDADEGYEEEDGDDDDDEDGKE